MNKDAERDNTLPQSLNDCASAFADWAEERGYSHPYSGKGRSPMLVFAEKAWNAAWEASRQDAKMSGWIEP